MANADISKIFNAEPQSLAAFLGANDQGCFIPSYQRAYSWGADDVARLFEDTVTGLSRLPTAPTSLRFLGTIIAVNDKGLLGVAEPMDQQLPETVMTLIDGQQRLCTLIAINILLHDKIRKLQQDLATEDAADGLGQIIGDYLYDLVKTFQFVGRPSDSLWQNYPRVIRARQDQWARHQDNARYDSPIARLIWAYIVHTGPEQPVAPFEYAIAEDAERGSGHQALSAVIDHVRTALDAIGEGELDSRKLVTPQELVSPAIQSADFWIAKFPTALVERIAAGPSDAVSRLLRLMAFGRYLNTRMAITVVTTAQEDYAFDIFEALNTTGQPLTAFETFRPKVIETEGMAQYPHTPSFKYMKTIEDYLDRYKKADDRQRATSSLLIPFGLLDKGERIEGRLAAQRTYLRTTYDSLPDLNAKRAFTAALATTSLFLRNGWQAPSKTASMPNPGAKPLHDAEAGFCFEAMRSLRHDITVAPMVRFYAEADGAADSASTIAYEGAIKAMTAFSMMWRAAKGGTSSIDSRYRTLMSGGQDVVAPVARRTKAGAALAMPTLAQVQQTLWAMLKRARLDTRDAWVNAVVQRPVYLENTLVTRFLLLVALHNSVGDGTTGLVKGGGRGNMNLLSADLWYSEATETVEHVAPASKDHAHWPDAIYEDSRTVHQLGNLLPLPALENNEAADASWARKKILLAIFAAESVDDAKKSMGDAAKVGITLTKKAEKIATGNPMLPICKGVAEYNGDWNAGFIAMRGRRLAELAYDRMADWLGGLPATAVATPVGAAATPVADAASDTVAAPADGLAAPADDVAAPTEDGAAAPGEGEPPPD